VLHSSREPGWTLAMLQAWWQHHKHCRGIIIIIIIWHDGGGRIWGFLIEFFVVVTTARTPYKLWLITYDVLPVLSKQHNSYCVWPCAAKVTECTWTSTDARATSQYGGLRASALWQGQTVSSRYGRSTIGLCLYVHVATVILSPCTRRWCPFVRLFVCLSCICHVLYHRQLERYACAVEVARWGAI